MDARAQHKLQSLYDEYARKLPNKMQLLSEEWKQLSRTWTRKGIQDFHRSIHGLCGSSGTYGYHALSASARTLEIYLKTLVERNDITDDEMAHIDECMAAMMKTFIESAPDNSESILSKTPDNAKQDKRVYFLGNDTRFFDEVKKNLDIMNYVTTMFDDVSLLSDAVQSLRPDVIIADTDYLDENEVEKFKKWHEGDFPILLFCVSSRGDLATRLKSIRAGGSAFFLKSDEPFYLTKTLDQLCSAFVAEPLRILVVDDSLSLAEYYSVVLQEAGMDVRYITNPLRALDVLNDFRPDLLLLDVYMPGCTGLELAAVLRQESVYAGIPIIFLSTEENRFKQLAALNLGGDDFLTKPILPEHLVDAVRSRAKRAGILSSYMTRDSLTGLLNHTNLLQHLEIELNRASRLHSTLCFVMIDIDHFKSINDTYGHAIGDHVLRKLSEILLTRLRKTDLSGRYGGEEFGVILPNTSLEVAMTLCAQVRDIFSSSVFKTEKGDEFSVTFSAGIAAFPDVPDTKSLIEAADRALYQAKHAGRNREVIFRP